MGYSPYAKKTLDTPINTISAGEIIFYTPVAFFISGVTGVI